ncbi:hypothetical protein CIHG_08980 [Coccidioides immitis H538.4]|uniref:Uncharacterized protein n=2 Tax=Coccidioides immitis TaxID=5501 RepID=A0A0J8S0U3_COCIT|nr:hypothetical protein CIRG_04070 [Coccidioides immitis RMSCC 2394]KMU91045.1 hypothetical protein CIHG_08980 [Coccidioides immitis H538.4]
MFELEGAKTPGNPSAPPPRRGRISAIWRQMPYDQSHSYRGILAILVTWCRNPPSRKMPWLGRPALDTKTHVPEAHESAARIPGQPCMIRVGKIFVPPQLCGSTLAISFFLQNSNNKPTFSLFA